MREPLAYVQRAQQRQSLTLKSNTDYMLLNVYSLHVLGTYVQTNGILKGQPEMYRVWNGECTMYTFRIPTHISTGGSANKASFGDLTYKRCLLGWVRSLSHQILTAVLQHTSWRPYLATDADMLDLCQRDTQAGLPGDTLLIL